MARRSLRSSEQRASKRDNRSLRIINFVFSTGPVDIRAVLFLVDLVLTILSFFLDWLSFDLNWTMCCSRLNHVVVLDEMLLAKKLLLQLNDLSNIGTCVRSRNWNTSVRIRNNLKLNSFRTAFTSRISKNCG